MDPWLDFLNIVGATFWRGFPYDIAFLLALIWGDSKTQGRWLYYIAIFMALLIAVNLTVATVPAWLQGTTW